MSYAALRPLLFRLDAERAHGLTLSLLDVAHRLSLLPAPPPPAPRRLLGLDFPNPLGLAAGLDKNGEHIEALARLGFGFLEVGTVTPRPQTGNPRPRLFRLASAGAVINRMGFNNAGVDALVRRLHRTRHRGIIGVNIGKNADTPLEQAAGDYLHCLERVHALASYVAVNVSSPNTQGLRALQQAATLAPLLGTLKQANQRLEGADGRVVPLLIKIAPDLDENQLRAVADVARAEGVDGIIATNTTVAREAVANLAHAREAGGLSGAPLRPLALQALRVLVEHTGACLPVIGVGGIMTGADARARLAAGASLLQVYSGLVYRGPALVRECLRALDAGV